MKRMSEQTINAIINYLVQQLHISVIPTQAFRSYPPSLFPIKWHWVANL